MAVTVGHRASAKPANDVAADCGLGIPPATGRNRVADAPRTYVECVNEVIDRSGEKAQAIATDAEYSEFQFSRIRSCQSGSLDFVDRLPLDMQRDIARRWAERLGFTVVEPSPAELNAQLFECIDQLAQTARMARRVVDITNARIRAGAR